MSLLDTKHYEEKFYSHAADEHYSDGDEYDTLDGAIDAARDTALETATNSEVTHVLVRTLKRVVVDVSIEDV